MSRKTRTMNLDVHCVEIEGSAWGNEPLSLVLEQFSEGNATRRVRIRMDPNTASYLIEQLREIANRYAKVSADLTGRFS